MPRSIRPARPRRRALVRLRPSLEGLEGRLLMAQAGALDRSFGGGLGYYPDQVNPSAGLGLTDVSAVAVEPDGSVLVVGPEARANVPSVGVIRLTPRGVLDTGFGTGGEADVALPSGVEVQSHLSVLVQPDGKVVLIGAGTTVPDTSTDEEVVARFDADGSADPTFGSAGVMLLNSSNLGVTSPSLIAAALQADGKIVLVGDSTIMVASHPAFQIIATRLDPDGSIDAGFGTNGVVGISDIPTPTSPTQDPATESAEGLAVQPDGRIAILGSIADLPNQPLPNSMPELIRLNADGSRDRSLGQAGVVGSGIQYPVVGGLIAQPDGKLLVLGSTNSANVAYYDSSIVARVNPDGTLDRVAALPASVGTTSLLGGISLQLDGKVALSGDVAPSSNTASSPAVIRLDPDLTPDRTFGLGGVAPLAITPPSTGSGSLSDKFTGVVTAVGPDSQIVEAASNGYFLVNHEVPPTYLAVARLTATGSATPGDFTGDGISDPAIDLPAYGVFALRPSGGGPDQITPFGIPGPGQTIPAPGDYSGSGREEIAAYIPAYATYAYRPADGGPDVLTPFGLAGPGQTIPTPGDYEGTGRDDIAVYLAAFGEFAVRPSGGGPDVITPFGIAGLGQSIPVPGDYDGSGKTELAVYLPSIAAYAYRPANGGPDVIAAFGIAGAGNTIPVPGDYDGSGHTELGVYLPSLGDFVYRPAKGGPDVVVPFGVAGSGQTLPAIGDYTGSGHDEIGAYLPSYGVFAYRPAGGGPDVIEPFGVAGPGGSIPVTVVVPPVEVPATVSAASVEVPGLPGDSGSIDVAGPAPRKKAGHPTLG